MSQPYDGMSLETLEEMRQELMHERISINQDIRALAAEIDARCEAAAMEKDIAALEARHRVQIVRPAGVESSETVGKV